MRRLLVSALLLCLSLPALAQERAQITEDTVSMRFPDTKHPGPELKAGDKVVVILREGDRARVQKGDRYGWIDASLLGPIEVSTPSTDLGAPSPDFDIEAIKAALEMGTE